MASRQHDDFLDRERRDLDRSPTACSKGAAGRRPRPGWRRRRPCAGASATSGGRSPPCAPSTRPSRRRSAPGSRPRRGRVGAAGWRRWPGRAPRWRRRPWSRRSSCSPEGPARRPSTRRRGSPRCRRPSPRPSHAARPAGPARRRARGARVPRLEGRVRLARLRRACRRTRRSRDDDRLLRQGGRADRLHDRLRRTARARPAGVDDDRRRSRVRDHNRGRAHGRQLASRPAHLRALRRGCATRDPGRARRLEGRRGGRVLSPAAPSGG